MKLGMASWTTAALSVDVVAELLLESARETRARMHKEVRANMRILSRACVRTMIGARASRVVAPAWHTKLEHWARIRCPATWCAVRFE